jgi:hypothetical protein
MRNELEYKYLLEAPRESRTFPLTKQELFQEDNSHKTTKMKLQSVLFGIFLTLSVVHAAAINEPREALSCLLIPFHPLPIS